MTRSILGIDFGLAKVGVAIAANEFSEPYNVIRYTTMNELIEKIREIIETEQIAKIIVGISEGQMAQETEGFVDRLKNEIGVLVETSDETLSTQDAQKLGIEAGMNRSKRKNMEDAMAAAVMLQNYLDMRS